MCLSDQTSHSFENPEAVIGARSRPQCIQGPHAGPLLATMAADAEAVKRLLLCGAHTSIPLSAEAGNCFLFLLDNLFFILNVIKHRQGKKYERI